MPLRAPTRRPVRVPAIHANVGIEAAYRKRLQALITEMSASVIYWTRAAWKKSPPVAMAQDAPFPALRETMKRLADHWQKRFDAIAPELAGVFVNGATAHTDAAMMDVLKRAGFTVKFTMTKAVSEGVQATLQENVALIKSIPAQYLSDVESDVWRAVRSGFDLGTLTDSLRAKHGVTYRRASFIARDQSNKAKATIEKLRRQELGIKQAIWQHSGGGKEPRPDHVKAGRDKLVFDVDKGAYIGGQFIQPGELPNCLPGDSLVDLVHGCHVIWRYDYRGDMISIKTGKTAIRATPNHPFLTNKGWIAAKLIDSGDHVWKARSKKLDPAVSNVNETKFRISDVFAALRSISDVSSAAGSKFDFHGDVPDSEVETVRAEFGLLRKIDPVFDEGVSKLNLTPADGMAVRGTAVEKIVHTSVSGRRCDSPEVVSGGVGESDETRLRPVSCVDTGFLEPADHEHSGDVEMLSDAQNTVSLTEHLDDVVSGKIIKILLRNNVLTENKSPNHTRTDAECPTDLRDAISCDIHFDDPFSIQFDPSMGRATLSSVGDVPLGAEMLAKLTSTYAKMGCTIFETNELVFEAVRVVEKSVSKDCRSHVYTLESNDGWFGTSAENIITQNCRCTSRSIIAGFDE